MSLYVHIFVNICIHLYIYYIYACINMCIYVCICIDVQRHGLKCIMYMYINAHISDIYMYVSDIYYVYVCI